MPRDTARDRANEVVNPGRGPGPLKAPILRAPPPEVGALGRVLGVPRRRSRSKLRQEPAQHRLRGIIHAPLKLGGRLVGPNGQADLPDDVSSIGGFDHVVEAHAGLGLPVQEDPVHGTSPAVPGQE